MIDPESSSSAGLLAPLVRVRPGEGRALAWAFLYSFCVLAAWYVVRPIREAFAVEDGENLQWLFTGTFVAMLAAVPLWSALVARFPRRVFLPLVYHFFALNLVGFWVLLARAPEDVGAWARRAFFVWTSVFVLFVVSSMWSFLVDLFREEQCRRLFGFVAAGGTIGGLCGSAVTSALTEHVATTSLFLGPIVLLEVVVLCVVRLDRLRPGRAVDTDGAAGEDVEVDEGARPVGGGVVEGFTAVAGSPYLQLICVYMLFATLMGTLVYFQTNELVGRAIPERADRVGLFANVNLAVQSLTGGAQLFVAPRALSRIGVGATLVVLPLVTALGFGALGFATSLAVVVVFDVLRRATSYGLAKPTKEVLFSVVPREDKYKAKSFIDTAVYRGGDALSGWAFAGMRGLGLGLSTIAWVGVPLALAWIALSWLLGRREERMAGGSISGTDSPRSGA